MLQFNDSFFMHLCTVSSCSIHLKGQTSSVNWQEEVHTKVLLVHFHSFNFPMHNGWVCTVIGISNPTCGTKILLSCSLCFRHIFLAHLVFQKCDLVQQLMYST